MIFFFKQKTAYEVRISDWSSDVCSSGLRELDLGLLAGLGTPAQVASHVVTPDEFEQAMDGLWTAGGDAARGAVAAALQFYMGLRLSETLGLLAADVVPHGDGMVRVWAPAGRKRKTRARRLRLQIGRASCRERGWQNGLISGGG